MSKERIIRPLNRKFFYSTMICSTLLIGCLPACGDPAERGSPFTLNEDPKAIALRSNDSLIHQAASQIRSGDLILRTGTDYSSEEVKSISPTDKTYSHAGIASVDSSGIFIYHIEPDHLHVADKVRKESLDSFCNPLKTLGFAIARFDLSESEKNTFLHYLEKQYNNKIPFDIQFDLLSTDSMYCSEMIRSGLAFATNKRVVLPTHRFNDRNKYKVLRQYLHLPEKSIANREIIPIDHLFLNPHCSMIGRFLFHGHQTREL